MNRAASSRVHALAMCAGASALALASPGLSFAQSAPSDKATVGKGPVEVEAVVVTANRREQTLQTVGGALQVFSGAALEKNGAAKLGDFILEIPGVTFRDLGNGAADLSLRGVSNIAADESGTNSTVSTVGLYFGDVPIQGASVFPDTSFYDLARVEVLKGPQGTLYGEGAVGGAIRVIPNPVNLNTFGGSVEATGSVPQGGSPGGQFRGVLNIPLVTDRVGLRLVGGYQTVGGFINDVATGQNNYNTQDGWNFRGTLHADITSRLQVELFGLHSQDNSSGFNQINANLPGLESDATEGRFNLQSFTLVSGTVGYDLGFAKATFVSAYNQLDRTFQDAYPLAAGLFGAFGVTIHGQPEHFQVNQHTYTDEIRLVSEGNNRFDYVLGGFYRERVSTSLITLDLFPEDLTAVNAVLTDIGYPTFPNTHYVTSIIDNSSRQYAAYGEGTLHITRQLDATAGLRWYTETNTFYSQSYGYSFLSVVDNTNSPAPTTDSGVIPKFNLTWRPTDNYTLYAQAAKGFRSGGVNFEANLIPGSSVNYGSDSLWNYEVGARAQLFDRRLSIKSAYFHIDWSRMQLNYTLTDIIGQPLNVVQNAGSAALDGFETEFRARPTRELALGGSFAYTTSKLDSVPPGSTIIAGQVLPNVPRFTGSAYVEYNRPLAPGYVGVARLDAEYTDHQNEQLITTSGIDGFPVKGYTLENVRIGLEHDRWNVALFVKNLSNINAEFGRGLTYATASVRENWFTISRPRTFGITVGASF